MIRKFKFLRVVLAVAAAEAIPVVLLIIVVVIYSALGFADQPNGLSPEEFAPVAGTWVGPIGGFVATLLCAMWAARGSHDQPILHGAAVGVGTAMLDLGIALLVSTDAGVPLILIVSNAGRIVAGSVGGYFASRTNQVDSVD